MHDRPSLQLTQSCPDLVQLTATSQDGNSSSRTSAKNADAPLLAIELFKKGMDERGTREILVCGYDTQPEKVNGWKWNTFTSPVADPVSSQCFIIATHFDTSSPKTHIFKCSTPSERAQYLSALDQFNSNAEYESNFSKSFQSIENRIRSMTGKSAGTVNGSKQKSSLLGSGSVNWRVGTNGSFHVNNL